MRVKTANGRTLEISAGHPTADGRLFGDLRPGLVLDGQRIESVEVENQGKEPADTAVVIYRSNGRCTPYRVRLVDEKGDAMVASVNALSTASVKREDR